MQHLDIQPEQFMALRTLDDIVRWLCTKGGDHAAVFQIRIHDIGTAGAAMRAFQLRHCFSVVGQFCLLSITAGL